MSKDHFKKLFLVVSLVVIIFLGMSALGPAYTEVERSIDVSTTQSESYNYLLDLDHLHEWHFWKEYDPNMTYHLSGPKSAEGATYHWAGNEQVGKGSLEISKADAERFIELELLYTEPWEAVATNSFQIEPNGQGSTITWGFRSKNSFISRMGMLFMSMDKLLGPDYEKGLYVLKQKLEGTAK